MRFTVRMYVYFCITVRDGGAGVASGKAVVRSENPGVPVVIKDLLETKITKVFSVFCYIKFEFALNMVFTST